MQIWHSMITALNVYRQSWHLLWIISKRILYSDCLASIGFYKVMFRYCPATSSNIQKLTIFSMLNVLLRSLRYFKIEINFFLHTVNFVNRDKYFEGKNTFLCSMKNITFCDKGKAVQTGKRGKYVTHSIHLVLLNNYR